jgi:murein DD-endopeptidase MepM/ murein hydrolase activator NlpD
MRRLTQYLPHTITQMYKPEHKAIDLRNYENYLVFTPENIIIIYNSIQDGLDKYGNHYIVAKGQESNYYLYFVHTLPAVTIHNNVKITMNEIIGRTDTSTGNARGAHLHFAVRNLEWQPINPLEYLHLFNIEYTVKQ